MDENLIVEIEKIKEELAKYEEAKYTSKITACRGRLINKIQKAINSLEKKQDKTVEDINRLNEYKDYLNKELFKHKIQLKDRYSKEFIKGEAKVPDVVITLPKGIATQAKKVAATISEIKNANNNKAKAKAMVDFGKESGLLLATPVIFAGKFAMEHWYLLLLLWNLKRNERKKGKEKEKEQPKDKEINQNEQPQESENHNEEPGEIPNNGQEKPPLLIPGNPESDNQEKPDIDEPEKPNVEEPEQPPLSIPGDPEKEPAEEPSEGQDDNIIQFPGQEPDGEDVPEEDPSEGLAAAAIAAPAAVAEHVLTAEQAAEAQELYNQTLHRLNERSNGQIFIREIDAGNVECSDLVICRTPMEYLYASSKYCELDPITEKFIDAEGNITKAGYEFMLERNIGRFSQDTRIDSVIFEDPTGQYKDEFVNGYGHNIGTMYDRFTTVRCFDTLEEFNAALINDNAIYDEMREEFIYQMNVSESKEALQCLAMLGLMCVGSGAVEMAGPAIGALAANPQVLEGLRELLDSIHLTPETANQVNSALQLAH